MSPFFYIAERLNPEMIYCGAAPGSCGDVDTTSLCSINSWGLVNCTKAGCPPIANDDGTILLIVFDSNCLVNIISHR
jgi:hypothetical protein